MLLEISETVATTAYHSLELFLQKTANKPPSFLESFIIKSFCSTDEPFGCRNQPEKRDSLERDF